MEGAVRDVLLVVIILALMARRLASARAEVASSSQARPGTLAAECEHQQAHPKIRRLLREFLGKLRRPRPN
jgi:hypothetical protein